MVKSPSKDDQERRPSRSYRHLASSMASLMTGTMVNSEINRMTGGWLVGIIPGLLVALICFQTMQFLLVRLPQRLDLLPPNGPPTPEVTPRDLKRWLLYFLTFVWFLVFMILVAWITHRVMR